jgi:ABC-type lipoprotein export system ATPase subunit
VLISCADVHKTYRLGKTRVPVLRGVDLVVGEGEWVAILGASGSGKSTLLHLLGGLDRPDLRIYPRKPCEKCGYELIGLKTDICPECGAPISSASDPEGSDWKGFIRFRDQDVGSMSAAKLDEYRSRSVGFVFQFYHLLPELNVLENTLLPAMALYGRVGYWQAKGALEVRAQELLVSFGLGHRLTHRPAELSGGERQRVAIARALINEPSVLLADEPTGNLDRKTGSAILDAMVQRRDKDGRALIMVTHDQEVAARADRIVTLRDGRVAIDG